MKSDALTKITAVIQCKHEASVAENIVQQTYGKAKATNADKAFVITTGKFTANAQSFAEKRPEVELIDGNRLKKLSDQFLGH